MRKAFLFFVLTGLIWSAFNLRTHAQTPALLGDEWIDFQQSYYKIPVSKTGVYRITGQNLLTRGLPAAIPGAQFRLFRQGKEVPINVSANGAFSPTDYIEFVGFKNDGEADRALYASPKLQADPYQSLFSDTAWYFLTWTATGTGLRYTDATTAIPASPAATASRVRATVRKSYTNIFFAGNAASTSYLFYTSKFGEGEGFINRIYGAGSTASESLPTPEGQSSELEIETGISGLSMDNTQAGIPAPPHPIKISIGNDVVVDTTYASQQYCRFDTGTATWNKAATTNVVFKTTQLRNNFDNWGIHFIKLSYWRTLNFSGQTLAEFEVEASATAQLLALQNITATRLYDLTAQKYYDADLSVSGQARFYLEPSTVPHKYLVLTSSALSGAPPIAKANFKNYAATGGDYVIITHPSLDGPDGALQAYKSYRASATGGGYRPLMVYAPDLYDQFAGGISQHPLAIKNFLTRLRKSAAVKPTHVALLGHGVSYPVYRSGATAAFSRALVPTYGHPGSDALLTDNGSGTLSIGRVSVLNSTELITYLNKVKAYEEALTRVPAVPTLETESWKKKVLHIAGARDQALQQGLLATLNNAARALIDTPYAGEVMTIAKNTTNPVDPFTNSYVDSVLNEGMGILTFHGHAYAGGFDYNINEPELYVNRPKMPLFIALGCNVSQIFDTGNRTISERYILSPRGGAVAMLAADQLQFTEFHSEYLTELYGQFSGKDFRRAIGQQVAASYDNVRQRHLSNDYRDFMKANLESMVYQGDPALNLYHPGKPDFHLSAEGIYTIPVQVTSETDSFRLKIVSYNLAKGFRDSGLVVRIQHTKPSGQTVVAREYTLPELLRTDTTTVWIPYDKRADLGNNRFTITINPDGKIGEISRANNTATYDLFISGNNLVPVFPYAYSIVNKPPTLKASTLNPFAAEAAYVLEIDTTELFNSPLLRRKNISGKGGLVKWQPDIPFTDSTVYYWRSAYAPTSGGNPVWSEASFVYLPDAGEGWNQSHAYQYLHDTRNQLQYDATDRTFSFDRLSRRIAVRCKVMFNDDDVDNNKVQLDEVDFQRSSCIQRNTAIQIIVIDSNTGDIWRNTLDRQAIYGSESSCASNRDEWAFEFSLNDSTGRNKAYKFLKDIPTGKYVLVKSSMTSFLSTPTNAASWAADAAVYGPGNTLYDFLKTAGFSQLDSFYGKKAFVFWYQQAIPNYVPFQAVGETDTSLIVKEFLVRPYQTAGAMQSVVVGPTLAWKSLHWKSTVVPGAEDAADMDTVRVYGVNSNGSADTLLFQTTARDTSISGISAGRFPKLRLEWRTEDTLHRRARQLGYWRVHHTPVPELALNPSALLTLRDSAVTIGQPITMKIAVENVSTTPMDSVLVRYRVVQENGRVLPLQDIRYRSLPGEDTLQATLQFASIPYGGSNLLFLEANPDKDQPELYHPNNLGYLAFRVKGDVLNPLLDVTFDSIHISDRDIVSSHPEIRIRLIGQNRYRLLDDTSLIQVNLKSPDDPISLTNGKRIPFDSTVCRFIPARYDSTGKLRNEAYVIYKPTLTQFSTSPTENLYELIVKAKDASGNAAGSEDYRVSFRVVATSGISQVYNYPNPFTGKTRFAFLITGDALPKDFSIRIVDLKGTAVRTITLADLGPLRVGQNRPLYEWDGRSDAGVPLPPGIYLYRADAETDKGPLQHIPTSVDDGFKNGWGRMLFLPQ